MLLKPLNRHICPPFEYSNSVDTTTEFPLKLSWGPTSFVRANTSLKDPNSTNCRIKKKGTQEATTKSGI